MPAFLTHMLLGDPARARLKAPLPSTLARWSQAYSWGLIGPDILFFRPGRLPGLGSAMHQDSPAPLFEQMSRVILERQGQERELLTCYLAGFLGHYRLDSTVHPYVFSQQRRDEGKTFDRRRGGAHHRIEADIDTALCRRITGGTAEDYQVKRRFEGLSRREAEAFGRLLQAVLRRVYHAETDSGEIAAAFFDTLSIEAILIAAGGRPGLRGLAALADAVRRGSPVSAHIVRPSVAYDALNLKRQPWDDASQGGKARRDSVPELFDQAVALAARDMERLFERHGEGRVFAPGFTVPFGNGAPPPNR